MSIKNNNLTKLSFDLISQIKGGDKKDQTPPPPPPTKKEVETCKNLYLDFIFHLD